MLEVNQAACDHLGYSRDELRQLNLKQVDDPESASLIPERIPEVLRKGQALFESVHVRRDGTKIPVEVNARLIDYGEIVAILSISRDISLRKQVLRAHPPGRPSARYRQDGRTRQHFAQTRSPGCGRNGADA